MLLEESKCGAELVVIGAHNGSKIEKLVRLDSGQSSLPAELCRQAIASRVPFGTWTDEMIKEFGQSDEITISFRYR